MIDSGTRTHHRRRTFRASRSLRFLLLSLGLTAAVLGAGLLVYAHVRRNAQIATFAFVYFAVAAATLGLRQAMVSLHNWRKKRTGQPRNPLRTARSDVERPKLKR